MIGRGGGNAHVTKGDHADGLPDTKTDSRDDTAVQALDTVVGVNVSKGVADSHLLGSVRIVLLALHLHTDDLDGLVPGTETTTETGGDDLLPGCQLLLLRLAGEGADPSLGQTAETETTSPVGHLANGNGVDALVDALDALAAVNVHEGRKGRLGLDAGGSHLVLGDFDRLHTRAETHGGIGLSDTTRDTTEDTTTEFGGTSRAGIVLGLGGDEKKNGALGRSFNPSPWDQALVDCSLRKARQLACDCLEIGDSGTRKKKGGAMEK